MPERCGFFPPLLQPKPCFLRTFAGINTYINYPKIVMKRLLSLCLCIFAFVAGARAERAEVSGPDGKLVVTVELDGGSLSYEVAYGGRAVLAKSPLGLVGNCGDYAAGLTWVGVDTARISRQYEMNRSKVAFVNYEANELRLRVRNASGNDMAVVFRVSNHDVAFRYEVARAGQTGAMRVMEERTGFAFREGDGVTSFLTPQSDPMIGWKRSKPSYEEVYQADAPLSAPSQYGRGFTFPCLFRVPAQESGKEDVWVLVSETGTDSRYCACHLSDAARTGENYTFFIAFPMPEEMDGNGTVEPAFALPGQTPWRTLTVGGLKDIVETTAPWDNVEPLYQSSHDYQFGRSTWSWIVWQDASMNYDDQVRFINLAKQMGYELILIDAGWDQQIGRAGMERLIAYARSQGVGVQLWYSSSGWWNDIVQSPINIMDNAIRRKQAMRWMQERGVRGIKVDFFGGDKQEMMRLYEDILSDADDYGLTVIFHGTTLPRGWERMYPNYVGSEAVLASENLVFDQAACDREAFDACLHPFIRNAVGCMEWGGSFLNRRLSRGNREGTTRRTTDAFELACAVLFQNPIQNFAVTPENLLSIDEGGAPEASVDFMKRVPTTWDETRFIEGYPGRYVVLARRHHNTWYIVGVNADNAERQVTLDLSRLLQAGDAVEMYTDKKNTQDPVWQRRKLILKPGKVKVAMQPNGGFVIVK